MSWWQWAIGILEFAAAAYTTDRLFVPRGPATIPDDRPDWAAVPRCHVCGVMTGGGTICVPCRADQRAELAREQFRRTPQPAPSRTVIHDRRRVDAHLRDPFLLGNLIEQLHHDDTVDDRIVVKQWGGNIIRYDRREQR